MSFAIHRPHDNTLPGRTIPLRSNPFTTQLVQHIMILFTFLLSVPGALACSWAANIAVSTPFAVPLC
jgi:hypothetical protein